MRDLSQEKVWTYSDSSPKGDWGKCQVRKNDGAWINNYQDLAAKSKLLLPDQVYL
tara:strand:+ start:332 stop:496 length:165 start_codon:yes stop_codon:yes gene_type:complete